MVDKRHSCARRWKGTAVIFVATVIDIGPCSGTLHGNSQSGRVPVTWKDGCQI